MTGVRLRPSVPIALSNIAKELIAAAYRDFAIVCHQRSGSHMLATALNSHPEVCCQGELLQTIKTPHKVYAPRPIVPHGVSGAILMYGHWKLTTQLGLNPKKCIHLLRDPIRTAISVAKNLADEQTRGPEHRPHFPRGSKHRQMVEFDATAVPELAARIAERQQRFAVFLADRTVLEIRYEDLTGEKDVEVLPEQASSRILEFLGVIRTDVRLVPAVKKSS